MGKKNWTADSKAFANKLAAAFQEVLDEVAPDKKTSKGVFFFSKQHEDFVLALREDGKKNTLVLLDEMITNFGNLFKSEMEKTDILIATDCLKQLKEKLEKPGQFTQKQKKILAAVDEARDLIMHRVISIGLVKVGHPDEDLELLMSQLKPALLKNVPFTTWLEQKKKEILRIEASSTKDCRLLLLGYIDANLPELKGRG